MQTLFLRQDKAARRRVAALGMSPAQEIYFRLVLKLRERRKGNFARDVVIGSTWFADNHQRFLLPMALKASSAK